MNQLFRFFERRTDPYPEKPLNLEGVGLMGFIMRCCAGQRRYLLLMIVLTALVGVFEALLYAWMGDVIDWMSSTDPSQLFSDHKIALLAMLAVVLISPLVVGLNSLTHFQTLQGVMPMRLRWLFHKLLLGQSYAFFTDELSGRISAKLMQTALAVREVVMTFCSILTYAGVYFVSTGVILVTLDPLLLVPFAVWMVVFFGMLAFFVPRLKAKSSAQADARSLMTGRITDTYANIQTVKLFSHAGREQDYARAAMEPFLETVHWQMRYVSLVEFSAHLINTTLVVATLLLGIWQWQSGDLSVGAVATATALSLRVNGLSHWIMWTVAGLFENLGVVEDGLRTLKAARTVTDDQGALKLNVPHGQIDFENLSYSYPGYGLLFDGFNLSIKPGERIGLVGPSGAGKSTLLQLLLRFYDLKSGEILIDGQPINRVSQDSLRQQIGMVTQDTALLNRSIRENIAYGLPSANEAQIRAAAEQAEALEFIEALRDPEGRSGFDTLVGERGVKLSGGQRQRIAIARVLLKNAPILLLDEATSALDSEIELAITKSLNLLMQDKTVIAVAHRLSTIAHLDRLIVIDEGRVIEQGTHEELLARGGLYSRLWSHQSGGYLGD